MADATRIAATPEVRTNLVFFGMAAPHTIAFGYVRRPDCSGRGDEQTARVADEVRAGCQQRVPNDMANLRIRQISGAGFAIRSPPGISATRGAPGGSMHFPTAVGG